MTALITGGRIIVRTSAATTTILGLASQAATLIPAAKATSAISSCTRHSASL
jgi:hypothetical protein